MELVNSKIEELEGEIESINIALVGWVSHSTCDTRTRLIIDLESKLEQKKNELRNIKTHFGL
jgi:hypothetical protein